MKRGSSVRVIEDYDLFDTNINGYTCIFLKETTTSKFLVYVPEVEEWAELSENQFEKVRGPVPQENLDFVKNIRTMVCTFET